MTRFFTRSIICYHIIGMLHLPKKYSRSPPQTVLSSGLFSLDVGVKSEVAEKCHEPDSFDKLS
jgi:hypothetical protein